MGDHQAGKAFRRCCPSPPPPPDLDPNPPTNHTALYTGVTSDVGKVRETMDGESHPALLLVDGVSSIGALNFEFDTWKVDVAVTGSQKALSLPTGLAVVAISEKVNLGLLGPQLSCSQHPCSPSSERRKPRIFFPNVPQRLLHTCHPNTSLYRTHLVTCHPKIVLS